MGTVMIVVLMLVSIGLTAFSFVKKDEHPEMDRKIENFSISLMKEMYQMNKRIQLLENAAFTDEKERAFAEALSEEEAQKKQLISMNKKGYSTAEIAGALEMPEADVKTILAYEYDKSEAGL